MKNPFGILIVFLIGLAIIFLFVLIFFLGYRYYLNLRIQNKCKKKYFLHPFTFMLFMVITLLLVVIGVSHYNMRELRIENNELNTAIENLKSPTFTPIKEDNHVYDIYINGIKENNLSGYVITKETKNDFECFIAKSNQDIKYMANYMVYIKYIGTESELNGYLKYTINDKNSFQGNGKVEKEYIILADSFNSLPKEIEIGLSSSLDKEKEDVDSIVKFEISK